MRKSESGQTLVLTVLLLPVILCFAGLVIDTGYWLVIKRNLQGDADAAALAAVKELPDSSSQAQLVTHDYVENQNIDDEATVQSVEFSNSNNRIKVTVKRTAAGAFLSLFGVEPTITAVAQAQTLQLKSAVGMLPLGVMRDSYTLGVDNDIKTDGSSSNHGPIAPNHGPPSCSSSSGAADFKDLIAGSYGGGLIACAYDPLVETIDTQTGNVSGPTRQGFDSRIGSNTDSFADVFQLDADTGRYLLIKPESPRVALIPVVENANGTNQWPQGHGEVLVVGYVLAYIGKTSAAGYPAYTNGGADVWLTPVQVILPSDYEANFAETLDTDLDAPVAYRLVD
jgi:Flp pilus assembly protein TadG